MARHVNNDATMKQAVGGIQGDLASTAELDNKAEAVSSGVPANFAELARLGGWELVEHDGEIIGAVQTAPKEEPILFITGGVRGGGGKSTTAMTFFQLLRQAGRKGTRLIELEKEARVKKRYPDDKFVTFIKLPEAAKDLAKIERNPSLLYAPFYEAFKIQEEAAAAGDVTIIDIRAGFEYFLANFLLEVGEDGLEIGKGERVAYISATTGDLEGITASVNGVALMRAALPSALIVGLVSDIAPALSVDGVEQREFLTIAWNLIDKGRRSAGVFLLEKILAADLMSHKDFKNLSMEYLAGMSIVDIVQEIDIPRPKAAMQRARLARHLFRVESILRLIMPGLLPVSEVPPSEPQQVAAV